jgi:hypothetical protein
MRGRKKKKGSGLDGMYQNVLITLDDGSVHTFSGRAFSSGKNEKREIKKIQFTLPKPLPFGLAFEETGDEEKK